MARVSGGLLTVLARAKIWAPVVCCSGSTRLFVCVTLQPTTQTALSTQPVAAHHAEFLSAMVEAGHCEYHASVPPPGEEAISVVVDPPADCLGYAHAATRITRPSICRSCSSPSTSRVRSWAAATDDAPFEIVAALCRMPTNFWQLRRGPKAVHGRRTLRISRSIGTPRRS